MSGGKITTDWGNIILSRTYTNDGTYSIPGKYKLGIGITDAGVSDTDLEKAIPITGTETVDNCGTANWTESTDAIADATNATTYKEGGSETDAKSLSLGKDGTASTLASYYKSTTSVNGTSKDLMVWVYIINSAALNKLASTDCLEIRFGSDSSNYYKYTRDRSDLSTGWNLIKIAISSGFDSTTGTPVITALDYSYIGFTTTNATDVFTSADLIMDLWLVASSGDYTGTYDTGYPSINTSTLEVTTRATVLSTEANGYPVTEMGFFNTDTSPVMQSRDLFASLSKSNTDEIVVVSKDILNLNT